MPPAHNSMEIRLIVKAPLKTLNGSTSVSVSQPHQTREGIQMPAGSGTELGKIILTEMTIAHGVPFCQLLHRYWEVVRNLNRDKVGWDCFYWIWKRRSGNTKLQPSSDSGRILPAAITFIVRIVQNQSFAVRQGNSGNMIFVDIHGQVGFNTAECPKRGWQGATRRHRS